MKYPFNAVIISFFFLPLAFTIACFSTPPEASFENTDSSRLTKFVLGSGIVAMNSEVMFEGVGSDGTETSQDFKFTNTSKGSVSGLALIPTNDAYSVVGCDGTIAPQKYCIFHVVYSGNPEKSSVTDLTLKYNNGAMDVIDVAATGYDINADSGLELDAVELDI